MKSTQKSYTQDFTEILAAEEGVATLRLIQNKKNNLYVYDYSVLTYGLTRVLDPLILVLTG